MDTAIFVAKVLIFHNLGGDFVVEKIKNAVSDYMKKIGSKGGKKSRRVLLPNDAIAMVRIREENKRKSK